MFSIITPLDSSRLAQFKVTKRAYDKFPQSKEFIIPTRNYKAVRDYLTVFNLMEDVKLLKYEWDEGFNCSMALNLGLGNARYQRVIITSPEVLPLTPVLEQFEALSNKNIIAQVFDESEDGGKIEHAGSPSLVNSSFRADSPAMYFLAVFNKIDLEKINGWDEEFMKGYAYEDNDFGERWLRAGLSFEVHDDIQGLHQYHKRSETIVGGTDINHRHFQENNAHGVIRPKNGLIKE